MFIVGPKNLVRQFRCWITRWTKFLGLVRITEQIFILYFLILVIFLFGLLTFRLLAERETFVKTKWWLASSVSLDICFLKKDLWQLCLYLLCTNRWYIYTYIVYICFTISTVLYELSLFFCLSLSFSYDNLLWSGGSVT